MQENRVVWSEGMFLKVQHFQQADRWTERLMRSAIRNLSPFAWGLSSFSINREILGVGRFGLNNLQGFFPDGTYFEAPGFCDLPDPLSLEDGVKNEIVYLCLPNLQPGVSEIDAIETSHPTARYKRERYEAQDANADSSLAADINIGRVKLQLRHSGMELNGFERIPVARILEVRADQSVLLDEAFIATTLQCGTDPILHNILLELLGIVTHRAEAIADRMADPTIRGTAEIADFQFLQLLNRYEMQLRYFADNPSTVHPADFYTLCLMIAGEVATFTKQRRRGITFPSYSHANIQESFAPVIADIKLSLSSVLERSAIEIPLEQRKHGVYVGTIMDRSLLSSSGFILAVRSDMPAEALRKSLPRQIKIGPVERIAELVNVALPGISIEAMPVAPRQLPYRPGTTYFELSKDGPLWKQMGQSGAFAVHLAGDFPSIEFQLWAIKA